MLTDNQILIKAAEKNYHLFPTPTNLVESVKLKRYYTPEQLCDLDVKTSVNKIGEIVNMSQVLNSMYWDKLHHGANHKELKELYCDIATLDVMSGLEIDSAKREIPINNIEELNLIREKYKDVLTTEDNKKILPFFFSHISRQKGYYDPKHKSYLQHDTSMDYLQTIVRRFRTKNRLPEPTSKLCDLFDTTAYRESKVDKKQVSHIMKWVKWYQVQVSQLYDNAISYIPEEYEMDDSLETKNYKYEYLQYLQSELIENVSKYYIRFSTLVYILRLFEQKHYYKYRNILLPLLFTACNRDFVNALQEVKQDMECLVEGGNDVKLFDIGLQYIKK